MPQRFKTNGKLFAVVDAEAVPGLLTALADVGFPGDSVEVLQGDEDAARALRRRNQIGFWGRISRAITFSVADQWAAVYAAALHDRPFRLSPRHAATP